MRMVMSAASMPHARSRFTITGSTTPFGTGRVTSQITMHTLRTPGRSRRRAERPRERQERQRVFSQGRRAQALAASG